MASLMEELLTTLDSELVIYKKLVPIAEQKTEVLIKSDLQEIEQVTDNEQRLMEKLNACEKKRHGILQNMGMVLNKPPESLDLITLSHILENQPQEQARINKLHDELQKVAKQLVEVNKQNKALIEQSLEMIEFNMNFIQSTRMSPGSNNYTKNASSSDESVETIRNFDARQ